VATDYIDYYKTLGLSKGASQDDIRKAYRKLAREHHPDVNPGNEAAVRKFQQINEANEVLGDPDKRKKYDQYGKDWEHAEAFEKMKAQGGGQPFGQYTYAGGSPEGMDEGGFSDFFQSLFGGGRFQGFGGGMGGGGRQRAFKGQDITANLELTLEDAYQTHKRTIEVNGKQIRITIPAGVEDGQTIRLRGHGQPGAQGGPAGDLLLTFRFDPDDDVERLKEDLYVHAHVDLFTALLGGDLEIKTFSGPLRLKVKPGTQNGSKLRLKGKGYPVYKQEGSFGDLYVELLVDLPTQLSEAEHKLVQEWAQLRKEKR